MLHETDFTGDIQILQVTYSASLVPFKTEDRLELDRLDTNNVLQIQMKYTLWLQIYDMD